MYMCLYAYVCVTLQKRITFFITRIKCSRAFILTTYDTHPHKFSQRDTFLQMYNKQFIHFLHTLSLEEWMTVGAQWRKFVKNHILILARQKGYLTYAILMAAPIRINGAIKTTFVKFYTILYYRVVWGLLTLGTILCIFIKSLTDTFLFHIFSNAPTIMER